MSLIKRIFKIAGRALKFLARLPAMVAGVSSGSRGLSLPARVAIVVALVVLLLVIVVPIVSYLLDMIRIGDRPGWLIYVLGSAFFCVVIPLVVYYWLRLLLEGETSPYQDIDAAWKMCLHALDDNDLDVRDIPIFLVIGSMGELQDKAFFDGARLKFRVEAPPEGGHWPLRVYASPDAVYIVYTKVGCLSALTQGGAEVLARQIAEAPLGSPVAAGHSPNPRDTFAAPGSGDTQEIGMERSPDEPTYDPRGTFHPGGTLVLGEHEQGVERQRIGLSETEQSEEHDRLEYLCHLIRRERHPICPVNGMLTMLPYEIISKGKLEAVKVQRALSDDTATIRKVLRLRFPAVALVVGMEEEPGFAELVRRVGRSVAERRRIGHGFDVWTPPIPERLEALCAHSCAAFEDFTYHLFGEKDSLSRPGNTQLFLLLCKVRRNLKDRLTDIIVEGFKYDPERNPTNDALLFAGCYFAATGEQNDRQAFVRSVLDKLGEQQAELVWTEEALIQEQRNARLGTIIWIVDLLLFIILCILIITNNGT